MLVVFFMTSPSFSKTIFICIFHFVFGVEDFAGPSMRKVSLFHIFAKSPLLGFNILTCYWVAFVVLFPTKVVSCHSDFTGTGLVELPVLGFPS